jgi:hypothetical protein
MQNDCKTYKKTSMKKSLNTLPLLLLALYYFFINTNDNISFPYKIILLGAIFLLTVFIIYKKVMAKEIQKARLVMLAVFILISVVMGVFSYNSF